MSLDDNKAITKKIAKCFEDHVVDGYFSQFSYLALCLTQDLIDIK